MFTQGGALGYLSATPTGSYFLKFRKYDDRHPIALCWRRDALPGLSDSVGRQACLTDCNYTQAGSPFHGGGKPSPSMGKVKNPHGLAPITPSKWHISQFHHASNQYFN